MAKTMMSFFPSPAFVYLSTASEKCLTAFELNAPHNDVFEANATIATFFRGLCVMYSSPASASPARRSARMWWICLWYGRRFPMAFWAFRSFEDATSFMADVIFMMPFTELILSFISFSDAILFYLFPVICF